MLRRKFNGAKHGTEAVGFVLAQIGRGAFRKPAKVARQGLLEVSEVIMLT